MSSGAGSGLRPVPDLDLFLKLQLILKFKERVQRSLHLASCIVLKEDCQIGRKLVRIMADLIQVVVVFVIAGIAGLNVVDFALKGCLQCFVVIVCTDDILIVCRKGGGDDCTGAARKERRTGGKGRRNDNEQDHQRTDHKECLRMLGHILQCLILESSQPLAQRLYACSTFLGCRACVYCGFFSTSCCRIFLSDRFFLLPSGNRV